MRVLCVEDVNKQEQRLDLQQIHLSAGLYKAIRARKSLRKATYKALEEVQHRIANG